MKTTDDFFIPDNDVKLPEELDYSRVDEYIRSAEAFAQHIRVSILSTISSRNFCVYRPISCKKTLKGMRQNPVLTHPLEFSLYIKYI